MRFSTTTRPVMLAAAIVLATLPCVVFAQRSATAAASTNVQAGAATFRLYCAVCHGETGKGNGPSASALHPRPSNLTTIARRNGSFPAERVSRTIRGADPVVAHGTEGMMVWNSFFLADANGDAVKADQRVTNLVDYIQSIQAK